MSNGQPLVDSYGRRVNHLRISLTDRCNFRCVYCMPPEGLPMLEKSRFLQTDEIVRFVSVVGRVGVSRYRLTGGEPLLRPDIADIVGALKAVPTVKDLSITTNGSRLAELAGPLREAGLDRVNVSLDSVDKRRFEAVTMTSQYERVRRGIEAALRAGFPVKLNMVVLRGLPDDEILRFVQMAVNRNIEVRFLEFMPLCGEGWEADLVYPIAGVREIVRAHFRLEAQYRGDNTAETYTIDGGPAKVGFIASLSEPFCDSCSRMRLTAEGSIRPCLFSDYELSVRDLLRGGASDDELLAAIRTAVANKPRGNQYADAPFGSGREDEGQAKRGPFIRTVGG